MRIKCRNCGCKMYGAEAYGYFGVWTIKEIWKFLKLSLGTVASAGNLFKGTRGSWERELAGRATALKLKCPECGKTIWRPASDRG